ncbi:LuxR C-terminal-related transcriptional regulator [Lacrimispora indolis]|uniref:LuxR C-terminal-related transcriptional regulator n=1 Tax=Lacrimispora indolis TaxID=69825 RepID=UPI00045E5CC6|nr:response regulator transcription factor [Lacrimispora indolis]MBE7718939.1 response regulator transcription factor [Lacrimispora celerecrescens]
MMLILDDHPLSRQGIESIIRMIRPQEVIKQAGSVNEAIRCMEQNEIEMAFIDVNLGKESGFNFLEWLVCKKYACKKFFITSSSSQNDFLYARELGADAYVLKDAFIDEIVYALKVVERGGKFYSPALVEVMNQVSEEERMLGSLTQREREVLSLLSRGLSNAKISRILYISEGTTKKHVTSILNKLEMSGRMEAVVFASKNSFLFHHEPGRYAGNEVKGGCHENKKVGCHL